MEEALVRSDCSVLHVMAVIFRTHTW